MAASHFASSWSSFALFPSSLITRFNSIIPLFSLHSLSLSPTLSFSKCDGKKSAAFITTRMRRATKILKFVKVCEVVLLLWKQRENREKILSLSFLCDDF